MKVCSFQAHLVPSHRKMKTQQASFRASTLGNSSEAVGANESPVGPSKARERSWSQWTPLPLESSFLQAQTSFDHLLESPN